MSSSSSPAATASAADTTVNTSDDSAKTSDDSYRRHCTSWTDYVQHCKLPIFYPTSPTYSPPEPFNPNDPSIRDLLVSLGLQPEEKGVAPTTSSAASSSSSAEAPVAASSVPRSVTQSRLWPAKSICKGFNVRLLEGSSAPASAHTRVIQHLLNASGGAPFMEAWSQLHCVAIAPSTTADIQVEFTDSAALQQCRTANARIIARLFTEEAG